MVNNNCNYWFNASLFKRCYHYHFAKTTRTIYSKIYQAMILQIHDNLLVSDIKERFSNSFPCFKIEFYDMPHHNKKENLEKYRINSEKRIGEIRNNRNEGFLEIKSWYTVKQIEKNFSELFGLNIQIFKKENGRWIRNHNADKLSLQPKGTALCYAN